MENPGGRQLSIRQIKNPTESSRGLDKFDILNFSRVYCAYLSPQINPPLGGIDICGLWRKVPFPHPGAQRPDCPAWFAFRKGSEKMKLFVHPRLFIEKKLPGDEKASPSVGPPPLQSLVHAFGSTLCPD